MYSLVISLLFVLFIILTFSLVFNSLSTSLCSFVISINVCNSVLSLRFTLLFIVFVTSALFDQAKRLYFTITGRGRVLQEL